MYKKRLLPLLFILTGCTALPPPAPFFNNGFADEELIPIPINVNNVQAYLISGEARENAGQNQRHFTLLLNEIVPKKVSKKQHGFLSSTLKSYEIICDKNLLREKQVRMFSERNASGTEIYREHYNKWQAIPENSPAAIFSDIVCHYDQSTK